MSPRCPMYVPLEFLRDYCELPLDALGLSGKQGLVPVLNFSHHVAICVEKS